MAESSGEAPRHQTAPILPASGDPGAARGRPSAAWPGPQAGPALVEKHAHWLGRLIRDIRRKIAGDPVLETAFATVLERAERIEGMLRRLIAHARLRLAARREARVLVQRFGWNAWTINRERSRYLPRSERKRIRLVGAAIGQRLGTRAPWDWTP